MKPALLLAGGGTGGHIFPALETARALKVPTLFTGSSFGMERSLVPAGGFPFFGVPLKGFMGVSAWKKALRTPLLAWSLIRTLGLFLRRRPRVVLGFGGYASFPALFWARALGIPYFLQEQNTVPGAATRCFAPKARAVFAAFPDLDIPGKVLVTGSPVRPEIRAVPALDKIEEPLRIIILGGSQGSSFLNRLFEQAGPVLKSLPIAWLHQTGHAEFDRDRAAWKAAGIKADVRPFVENMGEAYTWAHFMICRAGAMTIAETIAAGRPSLLIPFAGAAHDHQRHNAEWLLRQGTGFMMRESEADPEALLRILRTIAADTPSLVEMSRKLKALDRPDGMALLYGTLSRTLGGSDAIS